MARNDDHHEDYPDPSEDWEHKFMMMQVGKTGANNNMWSRLRPSFAKSWMPNMDTGVANMFAPFPEQMRLALPVYESLLRNAIEPHCSGLQSQVSSTFSIMSSFTPSKVDLPMFKSVGISPVTDSILRDFTHQRATILNGLRNSLKPLVEQGWVGGVNQAILPPNLRGHAEEVQAHQVLAFLEEEGIPLYLIPRGRIALRLIKAPNRSARRQVLSDCYKSIIDDCAVILENLNSDVVSEEAEFVCDGIGAMRSGHYRSAQAMFTVTLDTLINHFYPDRKNRTAITSRKKGADIPEEIFNMGVDEAMVWLPIWNAHEQFWSQNGDTIPTYYSRHASVHGVSTRQFSKRNCVQVLMLITSLMGYADQNAPSTTCFEA